MNYRFLSLFIILFLITCNMLAQETNQFDAEGNRHGIWQQYYKGSKQLRYEGNFLHGKETGIFKFYCETCKDQPAVTKEFNEANSLATVKYYSPEGKLLSEGIMDGKIREGTWKYYDEESCKLILEETYHKDKLEGEKITYYDNGLVTEKANYKEGVLDGENIFWNENGNLIKALNYENGKLNGKAVFYTSSGQKMMEGYYKDDKESGIWKYYSDGKVVQEITNPD